MTEVTIVSYVYISHFRGQMPKEAESEGSHSGLGILQLWSLCRPPSSPSYLIFKVTLTTPVPDNALQLLPSSFQWVAKTVLLICTVHSYIFYCYSCVWCWKSDPCIFCGSSSQYNWEWNADQVQKRSHQLIWSFFPLFIFLLSLYLQTSLSTQPIPPTNLL